MANVYQQAAKRRKVVYLFAIVALLILSLAVRGTFFRVDRKSLDEVSNSSTVSLTLDGRAKVHELTELQQGEKQLGGAAIQLLLTGSRGFAVSALWLNALEKQKKQEWNELDISIDSITKLQPHFTAPWLFQSWNLAYNVSVEMDRLNDMYFYIARGISVGAEGESVNRQNPDLRYNLGFFYQNKFGVSDRVTTLRCLYQLSCIPDEDRDPERLMTTNSEGARVVNLEAFTEFCRNNPQLIRRLKEVRIAVDGSEEKAQTLARTPEAVVAFLTANRKLPSRYKPNTRELNDRLKQFPVLPDFAGSKVNRTTELDFRTAFGDHEQDAFIASRAWYSLANDALPPPSNKPNLDGSYNPDPLKYRIPKRPATIIFRQGPMRAQTYYAERLTKEGWFDQDPWFIDDQVDEDRFWLTKLVDGKRTSIGIRSQSSAQDAWKEAARRWQEHGLANGLRMEPARLQTYQAKAEEYCRRHPGRRVGDAPEPLTAQEENDERLKEQYEAQAILQGWAANRSMTNYDLFDVEADGMSANDAMFARKRFYQAEKMVREAAKYKEAVELYDEGFAAWKRLLMEKRDCRRRRATETSMSTRACKDFRDVERYEEDVYQWSLRYAKIAQDVRTKDLREATVAVHDLLRHAGGSSSGNMLHGLGDLGVWYPLVPQLKAIPPLALPGPMDGYDPEGELWISDDVKYKVRERLGLTRRGPAMEAGPGGPPAGPAAIPAPGG